MKRLSAVCLIALFSFGLILKHVYPTLTTGDVAEFIVNAYTLGINHPGGYPLYSLLGKTFSCLPLGSPAFRVNLLSSVATAVSAVMLLLTIELAGSFPLGMIVGALLPVGVITFNQSLSAEAYTLNLFFLSLLIYFSRVISVSGKRYYIVPMFFCWTLGLTNHYLALLACPLFLVVLNPFQVNKRQVFSGFFILILGLALYLYLPLRARQSPPINWGDPASITTFISHLKRSEYRQLEFGRIVPFGDKLKYTLHFLKLNLAEFSPLVLLGSCIGLFVLIKRRLKWGSILLLEYLLFSLGLIALLHFPFRVQDTFRVSVYYLPAFYLSLIFLFFGLNWLLRKLHRISYLRYLVVLILIPPFLQYIQFPSRRLNMMTHNYLESLTISTPPHTQVVTEGDNETFGLFYLKFVEAVRPDLEIFNMFETSLRTILKIDPNRPVAYTNQRNAPPNYQPNGLVYLANKYRASPWRYFPFDGIKGEMGQWENFERELLATYSLHKGIDYQSRDDQQQAIRLFSQAVTIGEDFAWINNNAGTILADLSLNEEALALYQRALIADPQYLEAYFNLGWQLKKQNDPSFKRIFEKYLILSKGIEEEIPFRRQVMRMLSSGR